MPGSLKKQTMKDAVLYCLNGFHSSPALIQHPHHYHRMHNERDCHQCKE